MTSKLLFVLLLSTFVIPFQSKSQWVKQTDFSGELFRDLHFINADTGFLAGGVYEDPILCRTYDGGVTWDTIGAEIEGPIQSICFINKTVGFISCDGMYPYNYIYKTADQGENWYVVFEHPAMSWNISFPTENIGYVIPSMSDWAFITKTTDGGETWNIINSFLIEYGGFGGGVVDFQFLTEDIGYLIYEAGAIYKTIDGGMTFEEVYLNEHDFLNSVCFLNADTGFVVGEFKNIPLGHDTAGVVLKTINGGIEWELDSLPGLCEEVYFMNKDTGFISSECQLLETHDGGENWQFSEGEFDCMMKSIHFPDDKTGYAISAWGVSSGFSALYKLDFSTGIENPVFRTGNFSIYPTPAKDFIVINGVNENNTGYRVGIYNQMGQKVLYEVYYDARINVSSLQPGVYIIEVWMQDLVFREKILIYR